MTWTQLGNDMINKGTLSTIGVGNPVAISGDGSTVVVGATSASDTVGKCYIFKYDSLLSTWIPQSLPNNGLGSASGDYFGTSVAVSYDGNIVAVGAPQNDPTNITVLGTSGNTGYVKIFIYVGGTWNVSDLQDNTPTSNNLFGYAVALADCTTTNNTRLIVGSPGSKSGLFNIFDGKISVFDLVAPSFMLSSYGTYTNPNANYTYFGSSVAISGDGNTIVGGSQITSVPSYSSAVFKYSAGSWNLINDLTDTVGYSLALSNDGGRLVIGNPYDASNRGVVTVYTYEGTGYVLKKIIGSAYSTFKYYGISVGLSNDGKTLVIGSQNSSSSDPGTVHVFDTTDVLSPTLITAITSSAQVNNNYGTSVDISANGERVVIAEGLVDGTSNGAVRAYTPVTTTTTTTTTSTTTTTTTDAPTTTVAPGGWFGWCICCSN